jgi:hypothetical protein
MKKVSLLCITTVLMITACSSPTPSASPTLPPIPTPSIDYQIVGSTLHVYLVVVDPKSNTDRKGLQGISEYLCSINYGKCAIWFWDDINKAGTSYPIDSDKKQAAIATYSYDPFMSDRKLVVYTLGDK